MNVPIFNGFLFSAEASEANYRAKAAKENTRDLRDNVVRDVRTAWLAANTAFQRVGVEAELAKEADLGLTLAQGRYQLGLGSIVELSQAQLNQTDAAIGYVNAEYQYRLSLSTLNFETESRLRLSSGPISKIHQLSTFQHASFLPLFHHRRDHRLSRLHSARSDRVWSATQSPRTGFFIGIASSFNLGMHQSFSSLCRRQSRADRLLVHLVVLRAGNREPRADKVP